MGGGSKDQFSDPDYMVIACIILRCRRNLPPRSNAVAGICVSPIDLNVLPRVASSMYYFWVSFPYVKHFEPQMTLGVLVWC